MKLPEPVGYTDKHGHTYAIKWSGALPENLTLHSEAQLKQAVSDALEAAINCYSPDDSATDWADKIRKLMEGL